MMSLALPAVAQTINLEIGAAVPAGSPWDIGLRKIASEWAEITNGRVKLSFPKSMANASQADIIQKMKLNLKGGLLDTNGLSLLDRDWLLLSMPSVIQTEEEFQQVMDSILPIMRQRMGDRYEIITIAMGGWIRFFSNKALIAPEDIVSARVGIPAGQDMITSLFQNQGARTVKTDISTLLTNFSNKSIDIAYVSPLYIRILWSQFKSSISHMSSFSLSPFFGALIINRTSWDRVPNEYKPAMIAAADRIAKEIAAQGVALENEAIQTMLASGLSSPWLSDAQKKAWTELFTNARARESFSSWFSTEMMNRVFNTINSIRQ